MSHVEEVQPDCFGYAHETLARAAKTSGIIRVRGPDGGTHKEERGAPAAECGMPLNEAADAACDAATSIA